MILLYIFFVYVFLLLRTKYVYDLSNNRTCNYFELYDIDQICKTIPVCSSIINVDDYLPESIKIGVFTDKGWGLVSNIKYKKDDIIYKSLIGTFPDVDGIKLISKEHGMKHIEKDIHCGDILRKHNLFSYYDCLLNHSDNPSAYHDTDLYIYNGSIYVVLKANRDIDVGEEITINYIYLYKYVYYFQSYVKYIYTTLFH